MDYFIVFITTVLGLYFHWWLYVRIKRWADRDLALSFAQGDNAKQAYMQAKLAQAQTLKVPRKQLAQWLEQAARDYHA